MSHSYWSKYKFDAAYRAHVLEYQSDKYRQDPSHRQLVCYKRHLLNGTITRPKLRTLIKHGLVDWYLDNFGKDGLKRCAETGVLQQQDGVRERQGHEPASEEAGPDDHPGSHAGLPQEAGSEPNQEEACI